MQNTPSTPNRRSEATQAAVDRYAADPAAKAARSVALAQAHHLSGQAARLTTIERDCAVATVPITRLAFVVASQSQRGVTHSVEYDAASDNATCDCLASVNGLPCGHAGAAILSGRALLKADALLTEQRAARAREAAAWNAALDEMQAREQARRNAAHAQEASGLLYRNQRPFSIWRADYD